MNNYDILKEYEAHKAPVPSYDELQNMNKAVNECMAANIKLVEENKYLKEDYKRMKKLLQKMEESDNAREKFQNKQNSQLKELLKECRSPINYALCLNLSEEEKIEFKNLLAKIKQALGEDK
jgi:ERCC4-related helicase